MTLLNTSLRFPNTALLATYNTFQYKAVVRELGKVFGLQTRNRQAQSRRIQWREFGSFGTFSITLQYLYTGFPSHLSIHAGGILIADQSIHYRINSLYLPKGFQLLNSTW